MHWFCMSLKSLTWFFRENWWSISYYDGFKHLRTGVWFYVRRGSFESSWHQQRLSRQPLSAHCEKSGFSETGILYDVPPCLARLRRGLKRQASTKDWRNMMSEHFCLLHIESSGFFKLEDILLKFDGLLWFINSHHFKNFFVLYCRICLTIQKQIQIFLRLLLQVCPDHNFKSIKILFFKSGKYVFLCWQKLLSELVEVRHVISSQRGLELMQMISIVVTCFFRIL